MEDLAHPSGRPLRQASVRELLEHYRAVLDELTARELIRTKNAPVGDLAEQCALTVYGGTLARNSTASYDLTTPAGERVQVKARQITAQKHRSVPFSPMRSLDLDLCLFMLLEGDDIVRAREWTVADLKAHRVPRANRNDYVVKTGQVLTKNIGTDRTADVRAAWESLLDSREGG